MSVPVLPQLQHLPANPGSVADDGTANEAPAAASLDDANASERFVYRGPILFDLAVPLGVPDTELNEQAAAPVVSTSSRLVQDSSAMPELAASLPQPAASASDDHATADANVPVARVSTGVKEGPQLSAILQQVKLLQDSERLAAQPVVTVASKLPAQAATAELHAIASRLAPGVGSPAGLPSSHFQSQLAQAPKPGLSGAPAETIDKEIQPAESRGKAQSDTQSSDNGAPASTNNALQVRDSGADKVTTFSQALTTAKDASTVNTATSPTPAPTSSSIESRNSTSQPTETSAASPLSQTTAAWHTPEFSKAVNDAQLAQSSTHSEMRIAMQTDKLGTVELRARVTGDEVGAAITVEKRDAHAALTAELPALHQALSEKQLRVEQLSLVQGSLHSNAGDSGAYSQAQERGRQIPSVGFPSAEPQAAAVIASVTESGGVFDSSGRLSVLA